MKCVNYVDPRIGTVGDEKKTSIHGGGKTHPGACYPFGMVQLSPDTTTSGDNGTGYNYCHSTIEGFSFNHMSGIGWYGDLGNLQIMPITGKTDLRSGSNAEVPFRNGKLGWKSPFSHENETARAGYYSVMLDRYGIFCEATVSLHTGMLRFTYPEHTESALIFNFSRRIAGRAKFQHVKMEGNYICGSIVCDHTLGGFGRGRGKIDYTLFFCLELSKPCHSARFFENETFLDESLTEAEGEDLHLLVRFSTKNEEKILVRCGISYVDAKGAKNNLQSECPRFDFENLYQKTESAWERALSHVLIDGSDETDKTIFYTCLYHTMLDPRTAVDVDGRYADERREIHYAEDTHRTMFSGWDVYRSEFPLLCILKPHVVNETIRSLLRIALSRNSSFPKWELMGIDSDCMVGDSGLLVMADAWLKGIRDFDIKKAYEIAFASASVKKTLFGKPFQSVRPDCVQYKENAYVPEELSETLEFLLADYALAQLALALKKHEDYQFLMARVNRYKENYREDFGFMCPRDENGNFTNVKDLYDTKGCVESNLYQQSWFVPYDIPGLEKLFGKERMRNLLENLFEKADFSALWNENYNHSNEPCHNLTHYFNTMELPERTQYWTRRVQKEAYRTGAFGFCGNEDVGQLSAWYVLSALGFAQVCIGNAKYDINTPLFRKAVIRLDERYHACTVSDTLTVVCDKEPLEYPYIESISLNGKKLDRNYLTYEEITSGGILQFFLKQS
ncbi:MAG: GH92 family glycosyl hydrolase [Clostridia bacterium]|nr:GH92 family glycosyl hydrolase [Clostridia bacterium]